MMPMSKDIQHAGMANNVLLCNRCGARQELTLPQPVDSVVALVKAWGKAHKTCKGDTVAEKTPTSPADWIVSDDTGISSCAIWSHMMGRHPRSSTFGNHPHDPSDFGRCYRLLKLAPEWRPRMIEMAQYTKAWAALAIAWDDLTALYEEEMPSRTCPKLYARMKELIGR